MTAVAPTGDALDQLWAKSPTAGSGTGELLTTHLDATRRAAEAFRDRVGLIGEGGEGFWEAVVAAAAAHDLGKAAAGFQRMVGNGSPAGPWGERHEVLSLGWLDALELSGRARTLAAAAVASHHRALHPSPAGSARRAPLLTSYDPDYAAGFAARLGGVTADADAALWAWLRDLLALPASPLPAGEPWQRALREWIRLAKGFDAWGEVVPLGPSGLAYVLAQGAVTAADHLASAHQRTADTNPLPVDFLTARAALLPKDGFPAFSPLGHQLGAAAVDGHCIIIAPTGSGKTEAALAWAASNMARLPGRPRLFYVLPYLASIRAMARRLEHVLSACAGGRKVEVGQAHSKAAQAALAAVEDDARSPREAERKARARADATRLFRERARVGTPYQLLRGMLAGPKYSGVLIDSANSLFVLDELHAYDALRFGWMLAAARLWERLGGRVCVASATMPGPVRELVEEALRMPVATVRADPGTAPRRHRMIVATAGLDSDESLEVMRGQLISGGSLLVVANTVKRAQQIHDALAPAALAANGGSPDAALLLHSRFRARDRARLEERLALRYRSGQGRHGGLVVGTQAVEVSLDVDLDLLATDCAPLEALLQRMGRCNRLGVLDAPALVTVHPPVDPAPGDNSGPAVVVDVYPAEPVRMAWARVTTHAASGDGVFDEEMAEGWLAEVYESDWGERWRDEVRDNRERFTRDFIAFDRPFADRSDLDTDFDQLFDGTEAVWVGDPDADGAAAGGDLGEFQTDVERAGWIHAAGLLIPVPERTARWACRPVEVAGRRVLGIYGSYDQDGGLVPKGRPHAASGGAVL